MIHAPLGRSRALVGRIALGTMNFGPVVDEDLSHRILDHAAANGVNLVDTADVYGSGPLGDVPGQSEEIIGRWLRTKARDQVMVATKFHGPMGAGPNDAGVSAIHIRHAVEASLRRLGTDHLDLYQVHHIDALAHPDEVWEAFSVLRQQGKVIYFGSSNFAGWQLARYQESATRRGMFGLVSEQSIYNLTQRSIESELVPAATEYGIGLLPWSPLGGGLLSGPPAADSTRAVAARAGLPPHVRERVARYEALAAEWQTAPAALAVAWLLHQDVVTAAVAGPRSISQLDAALAATEVALDEDQLAALDSLWPGPGRAPENYAW